jgi:hypothetical protein
MIGVFSIAMAASPFYYVCARHRAYRVSIGDYPRLSVFKQMEQIERTRKIINAVGRPIVTVADAIRYLDIRFAATWPGLTRSGILTYGFAAT